MAIKNQEALADRAGELAGEGLNGLRLVLVRLDTAPVPTRAFLEVYFHNSNSVADILADAQDPKLTFPISGGHRITAGPASGQVQVTAKSAGPTADSLVLTVEPIGDYSTYTLGVDYRDIDPLFSEIEFKFRPGCFSANCAPEWEAGAEPGEAPAIDYLAKDYDSFRHTLISAMMDRVPDWKPTSEADLDQVLMDLFSAAADELSDYQDRVVNEAYLGTARKRVSLARHARLMDYHIHQGNQASTWMAVEVPSGTAFELPEESDFRTSDEAVVFLSREPQLLHHLLNRMELYTWSGSIPALAAGSTSADLKVSGGTETEAKEVEGLIRDGTVKYLLVQEWLNPATLGEAGRDPTKRQLLQLLEGDSGAAAMEDPLTHEWLVRVEWREEDELGRDYCFAIDCSGQTAAGIAAFHGNLIEVFHGEMKQSVFKEPGSLLASPDERYFERTDKWGAVCRLPEGPLAYEGTSPGGEEPPESTLRIDVKTPDGAKESWEEVSSLVHSDGAANHFAVETDELGRSLVRFGNGTNGKELPEGAEVECSYQVGAGLEGNVGADTLVVSGHSDIERCWNPFDVTNGRAQEPVAEIIRRVPEAYRSRQLRAVTLGDYVDRAEELPEVSRAAAAYVWTGSWRAVRVTIDPAGAVELTDELREEVTRHLDAVRLIGEDLEIRPPRYVPLEIHVRLCLQPDHWPGDVRQILEQEFSDGLTPDGRMGFFHPDLWTFGQSLHESQILERVHSVAGVDHVVSVDMSRWSEATPGAEGVIEVQANEIILVRNDPDHMEEGTIDFDVRGGRG